MRNRPRAALRRLGGAALAALVLVSGAAQASAGVLETITLRSGVDGAADGRDDSVSFLEGPRDAPFGHGFTAADFAAAAGGGAAYLVDPLNTFWAGSAMLGGGPPLAADPAAQWIGKGYTGEDPGLGAQAGSDGMTALYAIDFGIASALGPGTRVLLDIAYLVDDALGDTDNAGLFVGDGTSVGALAGTANIAMNLYNMPTTLTDLDITDLVGTGTNTLYLYANDHGGGAAGIAFTARIDVVPEPAGAALLAAGLAVLGATRRRAS